MTDEKFEQIWKETREKQKVRVEQLKEEQESGEQTELSPMLERWRDGSDIT